MASIVEQGGDPWKSITQREAHGKAEESGKALLQAAISA
jgi:hypothetical protein